GAAVTRRIQGADAVDAAVRCGLEVVDASGDTGGGDADDTGIADLEVAVNTGIAASGSKLVAGDGDVVGGDYGANGGAGAAVFCIGEALRGNDWVAVV